MGWKAGGRGGGGRQGWRPPGGKGGRRRKGGGKGGGKRRGKGGGKGKALPKCYAVEDTGPEVEDDSVTEAQPPIEESQLTGEQRTAAARALRGESLFLTGAAGTGKSFLLRYLVQELEKLFPGLVAVTAPTGIAASNVGGQTIHSFAGVGFGDDPLPKLVRKVEKSKDAIKRWQSTRVLVLDEVSMLDAHLFESLNAIARKFRNSPLPFGGLQLIFCGDFLQLPPVQAKGERQRLFCFQAKGWAECGLDGGTVILQEAVRQAGDPGFARVLTEVRRGVVSPEAEALLASCSTDVKPTPDDGIVPTKLYCTNKNVDAENAKQLARLPGQEVLFRARNTCGTRDPRRKLALNTMLDKKVPAELRLKQGAQVILVKNQPLLGLVNGSRGVVDAFRDRRPVVRFDNGQSVSIGLERFQHGSGASSITRIQVPLKLGWALTVHKAQGMTLTRGELQVDDAFEAGQAYVALSRLTSTAGLWIRGSGLSATNTRAHPEVLGFYKMAVDPGAYDCPGPALLEDHQGRGQGLRGAPGEAKPRASSSRASPRPPAGVSPGTAEKSGRPRRKAPGGARAAAASAGEAALPAAKKTDGLGPSVAKRPKIDGSGAAPAGLWFFPEWGCSSEAVPTAAASAAPKSSLVEPVAAKPAAASGVPPAAAVEATAARGAAVAWVLPPATWGGIIDLD
mmetsp:Transcript_93271/g.263693  ORF Transcript_93271/g.263693 Transcript_93271/m.263693 type:complete len:679 (+) Transcript_93271:60-2096(+)